MWLLILAIVLLLISSFITAFLAEAYNKPKYQRPFVMMQHETRLIVIDIILLVAGFIILFIAIGWWGFLGIAIYWLLTIFLLLTGIQRMILSVFFKGKKVAREQGQISEPVQAVKQTIDVDKEKVGSRITEDNPVQQMSISELEQYKEKFKDNSSVVKIIDGYIEAKMRGQVKAKKK